MDANPSAGSGQALGHPAYEIYFCSMLWAQVVGGSNPLASTTYFSAFNSPRPTSIDSMTVTLHLAPEIEAGLIAQAQASGMAVEEYLLSVVESAVLKSSQKELSGEERATAFEAWSAGHRHTTPLSDYAVSREGIYEGRNH